MHRVRSLYLCGGGGGGRRCAEEEDSDSVAEGLCQEPQHGRICQEVCGGGKGQRKTPSTLALASVQLKSEIWELTSVVPEWLSH